MPPNADERKKKVFRAIVREYLRSAEPVGSGTIVARYRLDVSPATIRNDMAELEDQGLIVQPHTSAGRVPTDAGYRYYVDEFLREESTIEDRRRTQLEAAVAEFEKDTEAAARKFAKTVAELTGETAVVRIGSHSYLTGVSNLFDKPEFREGDLVREALRMVDDIDMIVGDIGRRMDAEDDVTVLIGNAGPFGRALSSVVTVFAVPDVGEAVIGILGPTRMDYDANVALMRYVHDRLDEDELES